MLVRLEDGVEEMAEELSDSKPMYAVVQVVDPNSGLKKNVQINWVSSIYFITLHSYCNTHCQAPIQ